ncbi:MAG: alpha/beta fold hydrolase, partial [Candidatus Nanopelagicales bacterium]|nr:alpha/beta fold hydrolase [Candidatus Nanopelagicales bacterium]
MSGPTVVLLHAFPFDARLWAPQGEVLAAAGWQVLLPNLPGFGGTDLLSGPSSIDSVADAILADLDHRGIDRAVLGGISLGGYITMAMLRKRPEIFAAAICCDTKASADTEIARENRFRMAKAVTENPEECGRILQQSMLPGLLAQVTHDTRPEVVAQVSGWLDDADPRTVAWYQQAMADRAESLTALGALEIP